MAQSAKKLFYEKVGESIGVLLLLLSFFAGTLLFDGWRASRFSSLVPTTIFIPAGTSLQGISDLLKNQNLVASSFYCELFVRLVAAPLPLRAGEYRVPAGLSLPKLIEHLQKGEIVVHSLTIPEGLMSLEIESLLLKELNFQGSLNGLPKEGSLLPETYHYHIPQSRPALVDRMHQAQARLLETLWSQRVEGLPFKTRAEAIVLASIVERETGLASERSHIAGVFVNRLRLGMPLQSDPTVRYGL
jgi:UPF0755 protein